MSFKKKILSVLTAAACSVNFSVIASIYTVSAEIYSDTAYYEDYLEYVMIDENDDGTFDYANILNCDTSVTEVEIPAEIENVPVRVISEYAFKACAITSVTIPDNVTIINEGAFMNCYSLEEVKLSDNITQISNYVFGGCKALKSIVIPDNVISIGNESFSGCKSLETVEFSDSINTIDVCAFYSCKSLKRIDIPSGVTQLCEGSFSHCTALEEVTISESVEIIEVNSFFGCTNLESVTIENPNCEISASKATISNGIDVDDYYFNGTIYGYADSTAQAYAQEWGYNFADLNAEPVITTAVTTAVATETTISTTVSSSDASGTDYLTYEKIDEDNDGTYDYIEITDCDQTAAEVEIPSEIEGLEVRSIGVNAFSRCDSLSDIIIPDTVTNIDDGAFSYCILLSVIDLPDNLLNIGNSAFAGCISLTALTIPGTVQNMEGYILDGAGVTDLVIEYGVRTIGNESFFASSVSNVTIPGSVISIGDFAFSATSLTSLKIPDTVTAIGERAFSDCASLGEITFGTRVREVGSNAFESTLWLQDRQAENPMVIVNNILIDGKKCSGDIVIPDNVEIICDSAFEDCSDITSVTFSGNLRYIGNRGFSGCSGISEIIIPDNVVELGEYAFNGSGLTDITIGKGLTQIGMGVFRATAVENVVVPSNIKLIDWEAFFSCKNLKSITIENSECDIYMANSTISNKTANIVDYYYDGVIYGYANTIAQTYAEKFNCTFIALDESSVSTTTAVTTTVTTTETKITTTEATTTTEETTTTTKATTTTEETTTTTKAITTTEETTTTTKAATTTEETTTTTQATTTTSAVTTTISTTTKVTTTIEFGEPTLMGDSDMDGEIGAADMVSLSKFIVNPSLFTLESPSANSNSDINNDRKLDLLDLVRMIEYILGGISDEEFSEVKIPL